MMNFSKAFENFPENLLTLAEACLNHKFIYLLMESICFLMSKDNLATVAHSKTMFFTYINFLRILSLLSVLIIYVRSFLSYLFALICKMQSPFNVLLTSDQVRSRPREDWC